MGPGGIFNPVGDALNEAYLNATKPYVGSYRCSPGYGFSKGAWGVAGAAAGGAAGLAKAGMCAGRAAPMFRGSKSTCFVAGTPVLMADGSSKAIEDVKKGDKVLSKDEASGKLVAKEVVDTKVRIAPSTLVIEVEGGTRIETTPEHPFYVEGTGWTPAGRLAIGNAIVTRAGPSVKIVRIETKEKPATVYNFEVRDTHSYFVGDAAKGGLATGSRTRGAGQDDGWLWVHNYPSPPDYETTFHNANPSVPRGSVNVHHAVEQQVQDLYPGRFTYAEIHAAENLRGIPRPINGPAHLSAIRKSWNRFYRANPNATRQQILDHAKLIDDEWGGNFVPVNGSLY